MGLATYFGTATYFGMGRFGVVSTYLGIDFFSCLSTNILVVIAKIFFLGMGVIDIKGEFQ